MHPQVSNGVNGGCLFPLLHLRWLSCCLSHMEIFTRSPTRWILLLRYEGTVVMLPLRLLRRSYSVCKKCFLNRCRGKRINWKRYYLSTEIPNGEFPEEEVLNSSTSLHICYKMLILRAKDDKNTEMLAILFKWVCVMTFSVIISTHYSACLQIRAKPQDCANASMEKRA